MEKSGGDGGRCTPMTVLVIEDNPDDTGLILDALCGERDPAYKVEYVDNLAEGLDRLSRGMFDAALVDLSLPDSQGLDTLVRVRKHAPGIPIVVLTGLEDQRTGVSAVKDGAQDYLVKGLTNYRSLSRVIQHAIERARLDQLKDDFINVVSHEIRTPLTVIRGSMENLHDGVAGELTDKQKGYAQMALRHSDFLAKIVNNMLDLARLESGKARVKRASLKPSAVIREPIQAFHPVAADRGLVLEENAPADLPDVAGDLEMLEEVMINLLSNAIRYARKKIAVEAASVPTGVQISVVNDGECISDNDLGLIFNKFVQLKRAPAMDGQVPNATGMSAEGRIRPPGKDNRHKGTGLGLAICRKIVELHDGRIWAENNQGSGVRFSFILPHQTAAVAHA